MNHNLKALIKAQILAHPDAGPEELALYVAQATPAADVRTFYAHLLIGACRTSINQHRHQLGERAKPKPTPKPDPATRPRPRPVPSPKLEQRRTWWAEMLAASMHVGGGHQKPLGDCTADDLRYCVKERDTQIGRIEEQMSNLRQLLKLMTQHQVTTVRELPKQKQWRTAS
ncbi:hypothetical protein [Mycobacterium sp. PSTR-4-N]|uniref:hypothetical protein n=1 Tax=Mycobacterium sp. PSTR-4-N TaxID=2917745 RepID=UPI001F14C8DB|nr:hypothetical protein [Mycobacterium sp. PSTR-4-N]MCG7592432.1 hypothetical protein [Mycobacterium sp. PSTR-4-N]